MRKCRICGIEESTEVDFRLGKNLCKTCSYDLDKKYYWDNKEKRLAKTLEWRERHREELKLRSREYYSSRKEYCKERQRKYYAAHKEESADTMRRWRERNHEKVLRDRSIWAKAAFRGEKGELTQLRLRLRSLIGSSLYQKGYTKRSKTYQLLGALYQEVLDWLGPKPCPDAHIDHICPCGQARSREELERLQHYWNLRWLPPSENISKQNKWTQEGAEMCEILLGRPWQD